VDESAPDALRLSTTRRNVVIGACLVGGIIWIIAGFLL